MTLQNLSLLFSPVIFHGDMDTQSPGHHDSLTRLFTKKDDDKKNMMAALEYMKGDIVLDDLLKFGSELFDGCFEKGSKGSMMLDNIGSPGSLQVQPGSGESLALTDPAEASSAEDVAESPRIDFQETPLLPMLPDYVGSAIRQDMPPPISAGSSFEDLAKMYEGADISNPNN